MRRGFSASPTSGDRLHGFGTGLDVSQSLQSASSRYFRAIYIPPLRVFVSGDGMSRSRGPLSPRLRGSASAAVNFGTVCNQHLLDRDPNLFRAARGSETCTLVADPVPPLPHDALESRWEWGSWSGHAQSQRAVHRQRTLPSELRRDQFCRSALWENLGPRRRRQNIARSGAEEMCPGCSPLSPAIQSCRARRPRAVIVEPTRWWL